MSIKKAKKEISIRVCLFLVLIWPNFADRIWKTPLLTDCDCVVYSIQCSGSCSVWAVWQRGLWPVVQESASWRTTSQSPQVLCRCVKLSLTFVRFDEKCYEVTASLRTGPPKCEHTNIQAYIQSGIFALYETPFNLICWQQHITFE